MAHRNITFYTLLRVLLLWQKEISFLLLGEEEPLLIHVDTVHHVKDLQGSSPLAEGDISPSAGRGRTTSHPCGYGPSCQGTSLDPEDHVNPTP